jgi:hypothetical protein
MEMLQTFESTIVSVSTAHTAHVVVVPQRAFMQLDSVVQPASIIERLGLRRLAPVQPSQLVFAVAILLSGSIPEHEILQRLTEAAYKQAPPDLELDDLTFAEKATFERMIPFEQSPLEMESLAKLVTTATGAGLGAYAGFVLFGSSPLLFIAAPAGMLIFGAAKGIADALEQGLRERLLAVLRGADSSGSKRDTTEANAVKDSNSPT